MPGPDAALAAWLLLLIAGTGGLSYVLIFRRDLVRPNPPPWYLTAAGWLLASVAIGLFIFLVTVVIGTS